MGKMMEVQMFAGAKDLAGSDTIDINISFPASVADIKKMITEVCPQLSGLVPHSRIAVDGQYLIDQEIVCSAVEVALIPPVSGG